MEVLELTKENVIGKLKNTTMRKSRKLCWGCRLTNGHGLIYCSGCGNSFDDLTLSAWDSLVRFRLKSNAFYAIAKVFDAETEYVPYSNFQRTKRKTKENEWKLRNLLVEIYNEEQ